jgi:TatD DNase family protein
MGGSEGLNASALAAASAFPAQASAAVGYDRDQTAAGTPEALCDKLRAWAEKSKITAIGEIGLDYHYSPETRKAQCALFAAQLKLASELDLPVSIHTREAETDTLRILDETPWDGTGFRGAIHCFTGSIEFAQELLDRRFAISFSGIVTFRNADALRAVVVEIPEERLLVETDSPYLTPVPLRGQPNEPANVALVVACLAEARGDTPEHIAESTWCNADFIFK